MGLCADAILQPYDTFLAEYADKLLAFAFGCCKFGKWDDDEEEILSVCINYLKSAGILLQRWKPMGCSSSSLWLHYYQRICQACWRMPSRYVRAFPPPCGSCKLPWELAMGFGLTSFIVLSKVTPLSCTPIVNGSCLSSCVGQEGTQGTFPGFRVTRDSTE
jgi:hypothetical protein